MSSVVAGGRLGGMFGAPLWSLGFRPFYLLASAFASLSVLLWVLQYAGLLPLSALRGPAWHGHEMLFGFTMAVVAGFLFTAARNWTQRATPTGGLLAAIALLWLAGRVLVFTPYIAASAVVNAAFPLAVAIGIGVPLVESRNRRNYFFLALLGGAAIATTTFHLSALGVIEVPARASLAVGLDIVLFMVAVIGGRVIPMFTNNGVPGAGATRRPWVERASLGSVLALLAADAAGLGGTVLLAIAMAGAISNGARLALWRPWRTLRNPLVWVLHVAYAWIPVHFALRALGELGIVATTLATHALTLGAIGGMIIGMMTRTARGHSGNPLRAGRAEAWAYALVLLAAVTRAIVPIAAPALYVPCVAVSAVMWSAGFAVYFVRYWPTLTRR